MIKPTDTPNLDTPAGKEVQKQLTDLARMIVRMELDADTEIHTRRAWWYLSEMLEHAANMIDAEIGTRTQYAHQQKQDMKQETHET